MPQGCHDPLVVVLVLELMNGLWGWLRRLGFGWLLGDFEFRAFGASGTFRLRAR